MTTKTLRKHGAYGLLSKYDSSVSKMLTTIYPEYQQAIRNSVMQIVKQLQLSKVEDLLDVNPEYP